MGFETLRNGISQIIACCWSSGLAAWAPRHDGISETAGNGTGNLVFYDGSNWIRVDTGETAAA